ncbi:hypothetical protein BX616_003657 [Lobosporangium transversale]|uniref:SLC41A/MgtE integral membrane domain-containing protein n=1 Tax=Lobosporangium transversale TaxID=64571 RepID=A0A1Y2G8E3_9FUNG|nr:hypothetical protein BCR41DRAFT_364243 [Lobosporangium transversale]KAF9898751.1 hypothetical protein BX616_003657 [Lobosporangium transversale]ORY98382.1 hypothetical protein BCR41DRAFT_364243 [Lobosporangium transversale]|eukprot:XP_021875774.1 hypothetical protein BCR41DRAFT_364243 [Lobosporangium transversale]
MSKLFTSTFSQAIYSPLNSQDLAQNSDHPDSQSSNIKPYQSPHQQQQHQQQRRGHFRHRSQSQSSNRSIYSISDQLQHQQHQQHQHFPPAFEEGEDRADNEPLIIQQQITSRVASVSASPKATRRSSAVRSLTSQLSPFHNSPAVVLASDSATTITLTAINTPTILTVGTGTSYDDEPSSPPPKYTTENLEYSEPTRLSSYEHGEEGRIGYHQKEYGQDDGLLMQALTTLVFAVVGLIFAGWLLDVIQHWQVFVDISELIILIPILLNLKGNLEMNLASRLSTAANMGLLDTAQSRNAFIKGNLALLQVQSLAVGSVAGLFSFGLGLMLHPITNNPNEVAITITASMLCAAMSSFVLGGFMCGLVLICRRYNINPDNIACPLASSFGDLVTLVILAACSVFLQIFINTPVPVVMLVVLLGLIPAWIVYVRRNKYVSEVAKEGWVPVFAAMVIAGTAGLTLERYITDYPGLALISPVLNGLTGNIGSIYASRISTSLHINIKENYRKTERTLFLVHIPIEAVFLAIVGIMGLGHIEWGLAAVAGYSLVALCLVVISLAMAKWITLGFWKWGYDPDNYALPIITSLIDVVGTALLVAWFWALSYGGLHE